MPFNAWHSHTHTHNMLGSGVSPSLSHTLTYKRCLYSISVIQIPDWRLNWVVNLFASLAPVQLRYRPECIIIRNDIRMLIMISRFKRASFYLGPHRSARHNWLMDRMGYFIFLFRCVIGFFLFLPSLSFVRSVYMVSQVNDTY